jgi:hypothetical protein
MSTNNVFSKVVQFMITQWYFDKIDPDDDLLWDPTTFFLDFSGLIASGKAGTAPNTGTYLRKVIDTLLSFYAKESDPHSQALTSALETINSWTDLDTLIPYPEVVSPNISNKTMTLRIPYYFDSSCKDLIASFSDPTSLTQYLQHFYQDNRGVYTWDGTVKVMDDAKCVGVVKPNIQSLTRLGDTHVFGYTIDIECKLSFMMMLRYYVNDLNAFNSISFDDFHDLRVGESIPYPLSQDMGCRTKEDTCMCLYYCVFGAYECPGYGYYYNQFFDRCKCIVTRAVPFDTSLQDRIQNKFGLCFDINCADTGKRVFDCQDQCALAKEWLTDANWAEDFINPASLDVDLIEKTCGFKVPQFSFKSNTYFWTWEVICGGICMLLTVPILVAMESWRNQKFSLRFIHILTFLLLVGLVVLFGYSVVGVQECGDTGIATQATCMDRLTKTIVMNHDDCDRKNPIFCQCDASRDVMKPCSTIGLDACKCQNNQLCMPGGGNDDIVQPAPATKKLLKYQLLYFCVGLFVLVSSLVGVGIYYLTNQKSEVGWVPSVSLGLNVVIHIVVYLVLFSLIVIFPVAWKYVKSLDQTLEVNTKKQGELCTPS